MVFLRLSWNLRVSVALEFSSCEFRNGSEASGSSSESARGSCICSDWLWLTNRFICMWGRSSTLPRSVFDRPALMSVCEDNAGAESSFLQLIFERGDDFEVSGAMPFWKLHFPSTRIFWGNFSLTRNWNGHSLEALSRALVPVRADGILSVVWFVLWYVGCRSLSFLGQIDGAWSV